MKLDWAEIIDEYYLRGKEESRLAGLVSPLSCAADIEAIQKSGEARKAIVEKVEAAHSTEIVLPSIASRNAAYAGVPNGIKLLVIMAENIYCSADFIPFELRLYMERSAQDSGIAVSTFMSDVLQRPENQGTELYKKRLNELRDTIADLQPDVILFEAHHGAWQPFDGEFVNEVRKFCNAKWFYVCSDFYAELFLRVSYWNQFTDRGFVFDTQLPKGVSWDEYNLTPMHGPVASFSYRSKAREGVSFCGTAEKNIRSLWLAVTAMTAGDTNLMMTDRSNEQSLSLEGVHALYGRTKAGLNLTRRSLGFSIVTGRSWEMLFNGCILIQEETPSQADYLIPYRHFIPFHNTAELIGAIDAVAHGDIDREQMVSDTDTFINKYYSDRMFWSIVLSEL